MEGGTDGREGVGLYAKNDTQKGPSLRFWLALFDNSIVSNVVFYSKWPPRSDHSANQ
ncbi:hypothetical protein CA13_44470 [Planctomycetes bacterium CA13]|uniref:Uncharacterized protein n=1 Tax=Novipirellula herctigrandis TaxID=2527986 RepID=A0A5C5Z6S5_9BACT|nr:hypothetical protein CA13_44470 [Planctomycetes bacterium CA13]